MPSPPPQTTTLQALSTMTCGNFESDKHSGFRLDSANGFALQQDCVHRLLFQHCVRSAVGLSLNGLSTPSHRRVDNITWYI